jgi:hypothetical protein
VGISETERGAVVVRFPEKPAEDFLDELKDAGFRFNRRMIAWVHKGTDENKQLATDLWLAYLNTGEGEA